MFSVKKLTDIKNILNSSSAIKTIQHEMFEELKISYNHVYREQFKKKEYYSDIQNRYFNKTPDKGIYTYSFSLYPTIHQPSGTANLGKIDKIYFNIKLSDKAIELLNNEKIIRLSIYNMSYNILRIVSGLGGLMYIHVS